jgi:hypothetical protein
MDGRTVVLGVSEVSDFALTFNHRLLSSVYLSVPLPLRLPVRDVEHLAADFVLEPAVSGGAAHEHACGPYLHLSHCFHPDSLRDTNSVVTTIHKSLH